MVVDGDVLLDDNVSELESEGSLGADGGYFTEMENKSE